MFRCTEFQVKCTVKPVNKGLSRKRQHHKVFIDKWSLFRGYTVLFNQGRVTEVLKCGLYLQGGLKFIWWPLTQV